MRTRCKKLLALLLAVAMVVSAMPMSVLAAEETATYTKVTAAPEDWSGEYLLVYEATASNAYVFDGSLETPDAVNNYQSANVSDGKITAGSSIAVKIEKVDGGYVLCSASGLYLYHSSDANKLSSTQNIETAAKYPLTLTVTADGVDIMLSGGAHMRFNANSDQMRFRYYKSSSYANQQPVTLYKLDDTGSETPEPTPAPTPTPTPEPEPEEPVGSTATYTETISAGDKVIIYNAANSKVMGTESYTYTSKNGSTKDELVALDGTVTDNVLTYTEGTAVLTVSVDADGHYSLVSQDGKYLYLDGTHVSLVDEAGNYTLFDLETATDGYFIKGTNAVAYDKAQYLEYYGGYFTCYGMNAEKASIYTFQFYLVEAGSETPDPTPTPDPEHVIADGDYVIWAPAYNMALSSTKGGYNNYYNVGVEVTETTEGKLYGCGATEIWTVKNNADGSVTISQNGKNLGMASDYTSLDLGAVHDTWTITANSDGTYAVKNIGRENTLEFSSYGTWQASVSVQADRAGVKFTPAADITDEKPAEPEQPTEPTGTKAVLVTDISELSEGDQLIFVAPSKGVVMGPSQGNYYASVSDGLTFSDDMGTVYFDEALTQILVLGTGSNDGTWSFNASGVYLASVSGSNNYLKNESALSEHSSWTVEIDSNGAATIKSKATDSERIWIRYNSSSPRFSCYKSGQADIAIYKVEREQYAVLDNDIADGEQFIIYYNKDSLVMTNTASGSKLTGVSATPEGDYILVDDSMSVLTASIDGNGNYTFTNADGKYLTTGSTGNSLSFADAASDYSLWTIKTVDGGVHIVSVNAAYKGSAQAMEIYEGLFTTFSEKDNDYYLFNLYSLTDGTPPTGEGITAGDQVVIYNLSAQGVLGAQDDNAESSSINNVNATVEDGKAIPENGGVIFTVELNGSYYRFYNETYGYLCSNGTGNNAFYSLKASEDADWTLSGGKKGGYNLESRTAKFNGKYSQYLEYYAGSYKTYSMYNVTDYDIYEFFFYPVADGTAITGGIVNTPTVTINAPDAYIGADYSFTITVDAVFGVAELTVKVGETVLTANADGSYTVSAELVTGEELTITVIGKDTKGVEFSDNTTVTVKDEPVIGAVSPAANSETGDDKRPTISAELSNIGENAVITMTVNGESVEASYADGLVSYTPAADLADGRTTVIVTVTRADGKTASKTWSFTVGEAQYQLYFGQLHSHTTYSDGAGSLESALDYIASLPESANVDFVAFTDHSNYFDGSSAGTTANPEGALYDMSLASAVSRNIWNTYKSTIANFNASQSDVIAIGGFEMTWSGGPGHINTFNTPGIVSRNNSTLNNKTSDAGMKAYYALLSQAEGANSISQFNHPGSTFGTFTDFAYWDALVDTRIQLVEVGNGEGAIGAGGYYPSYEYYTMALDKGWHVAPTNNQDNHKGKWGNANEARNVILTDNFTEEGIYQAIRDMRVYATEDKNLRITYTVNGLQLGSIIEEVPEFLRFNITVYDPDSSDSISKVELIVNSGKTAYTWDDPADLAYGELTVTLDPTYSYYYVRVTEGDGDIAVTAPVWVGESLKLGISSVESGTSTPVTGEELTITTTLFNSETTGATVKSLTYTIGGQVIGSGIYPTPEKDEEGNVIPSKYADDELPASGTRKYDFKYTPSDARLTTVTVTAVVELEGVDYTFTMDIQLDVQDADKLVYIGIDASHYNEYVNGNYPYTMGNFSELAAEYNVRTVTLWTSDELIAACSNPKYKAIILTAPSRRLAAAQADPRTYSAEEIAALKAFNEAGGMLIFAGWSDNYENYSVIQSDPAIMHMAATQNAVLEALGSSLRIADDATYDDVRSAADDVEKWRLYFNAYNYDSFLVTGVEVDEENPYSRLYTEVYSHYGGASVYTVDGTLPTTVTPVVFGHATTYSVDVDKDGLGGDIAKYAYAEGDERLMVLATEQLEGRGLIVVSGAAFMSNFEVQATIEDSGSEKNYSNYKICENLLAYINPVTITDIAEVQAQTEAGYKYTIEGVVTSNASGYDKDTAFFDCIYVQDATGGICCFPVAGNYKIGDKVRVTGTTEFYQGEMELQVTSIEVIGSGSVSAREVTAAQINDGSVIGQLITLKGTVVSFEKSNGLVQTIMVRDSQGNIARVFIDGYITTAEDVKDLEVGCNITVTGLASYDNTFNAPEGPFPRIRIRDRADIVCTAATVLPPAILNPVVPPVTPSEPVSELPFVDVDTDDWFYESVLHMYTEGIINGVSADHFGPYTTLSRAMLATMLYRLSGESYSGERASFKDVAEGAWYDEAVAWAAAKGIVKGFSADEFKPDLAVTREQAVAMLYRYAQYKGYDVSVGENTNILSYTDAFDISEYAIPAMQWACGAGIINGMTEDTLAPTASSNRAQAATMFSRFMSWCE